MDGQTHELYMWIVAAEGWRESMQIEPDAPRRCILEDDSTKIWGCLSYDWLHAPRLWLLSPKIRNSNQTHIVLHPQHQNETSFIQSPERGNINWAETQSTHGGDGNEIPINHMNMLKSGRIGWIPTQTKELYVREYRKKARKGFSQNKNEICKEADTTITNCEDVSFSFL